MSNKTQEIRAKYDRDKITVYQAYNKQIAIKAIKNNKFEAPFSFKRMTWIKPSFLWLVARSNWGTKSNQEYILGVELYRGCWEKALENGVLTHPDQKVYKTGKDWADQFKKAKVHIQWDPERNIRGAKLDIRSIQVGIGSTLIEEFNEDWIAQITDYTPLTKKINALRKQGKHKEAKRLLPKEIRYEVAESIQKKIGIY